MDAVPFSPPAEAELLQGIRRRAGIPEGHTQHPFLADAISQCAADVLAVLAPRSIIKEATVTGCAAGILNAGDLAIASAKLCTLVSMMAHPIALYGFALAFGARIDQTIGETPSLAEAMLRDAAAAFLMEQYARQVELHLRHKLFPQGRHVSACFCPGYCDWALEQGQRALERFLMPQSIGIDIHPSGAMSPRKSLMGVMLASSCMPAHTPCGQCSRPDCPHRR